MTADLMAIDGVQKAKRHGRKRLQRFAEDKSALKRLRLVAVAYSHVKTAWFPTEEAYEAEVEVEQRAKDVVVGAEEAGRQGRRPTAPTAISWPSCSSTSPTWS